MNKITYTLSVSILALMFHHCSYGMGMAQKIDYSTLFSKAHKSSYIFNTFWDQIHADTKNAIKKSLIRQHYTVNSKLSTLEQNPILFDKNQIFTGLRYLIPTTIYAGVCVAGLYNIYRTFTKNNGTLMDLFTSVSKASALWGGFTYTLPYFKKGFKKLKKGMPRRHLITKSENIKEALTMIVNAKTSFPQALEKFEADFPHTDNLLDD